MMPGTMEPSIHFAYVSSNWAASSANFAISTFDAWPVRNIAQATTSHWYVVIIRKAPSRRAVGPGVESYASARLRTTGKRMPPARALLDGTMVARMASVETMAYERPNERLPIARM